MILNNIRYCGECRLCCLIQEVTELKKPEGQICDYCSDKDGCTIYEKRPQSCKDFHCLWQLGLMKDKGCKLRPDKIGFIALAKEEVKGYSPVVQLNSLYEESFKSEIAKQLIKNWREAGFNIALVSIMDKKSVLLLAKPL
jgi:hypothetical protein